MGYSFISFSLPTGVGGGGGQYFLVKGHHRPLAYYIGSVRHNLTRCVCVYCSRLARLLDNDHTPIILCKLHYTCTTYMHNLNLSGYGQSLVIDNQSKEQDSGLDMDDGDELSVPKPKKEEMVVTPSSYSQPQQVQSNDHEIQELHERVESYKSLAEQFEKDNEKLQREAKEKEEHCVKLNDTLVETKSKLAEIRSEFAAKEKENESLKIKLATYKENMEKLQKKLEETKKAEIEEKDRIIEGLKKEIQHHQEKIMELKKELEEQKENLGRLKNLFVQEFAKHEDKNMKIEEKINKLTIGYQT